MSHVTIVATILWLRVIRSDPFDTSSDGFLINSTTPLVSCLSLLCSAMLIIQIWECALNWFTMKLVHEPKLDIRHLCGLGATYPKHVF